ncbi:MAG: hypothetical protein A3D24_04550 [Candidatus Blackburnbacteria bacterium RIFCSPHIGHO2_02_FULL_39_13]|uniref:Uncharacterized protein n=1 Tax=Candidatus Blackburnbacteria bacterium RIFCSPLOWO2_01_FULL_40_20 TaxID=1797519 RepID=A0A1G1VF35_9BACT|nr:MAG: hypothetical protein A3D24_04550 [Candidatus Blackburnbacteria bacterium RIFCSPHIGHO2_02_FULL_39_13]OGY13991.1 MAG: hypothetical protein A3A77_02815 [Candidatus Blackburnbacteria bacterium RIFCSPLOWO2_01_FULL_40_20]OGY15531.1 MAG: hypothetical protein A3I52_00945 [Candidatus Blackburnbacteria bacterium RIFCSPLOWO2_02_FULL_40_10]
MTAQDDQNLPPIEEATVVEDVAQENVSTLVGVENSIKARLSHVERQKEEIKSLREMVTSYLENDPSYLELEQAAKNAAKEKTKVKKELLAKPDIVHTVEKLKAMNDNLKELKEGLSYFLAQYQQMTGQSSFEDEDGEVRDIVYVAKLVKRSAFDK